MEKLTDLANKSDEFKHGYGNGRIDEEYLWKCKIASEIEKLEEERKELTYATPMIDCQIGVLKRLKKAEGK